MPPVKHVHIVASGENNDKTMPEAIDKFQMDRAIIIMEKGVREHPDSNSHYPKILASIEKVEKMMKPLGKKLDIKEIDDISLGSVRDAVLEILDEYSGATFYFNVSGGTKVLSNGLFMMAIWIDGIIYHVGADNKLQRLIIPRVHSEEIRKNENYLTILDILSKSVKREKLRKDIFPELKEKYKPIRVVGKKNKRDLAQGTLTKWTIDLENWGLIKIENPEGNRKDKIYRLTDDGLFTLKYIKAVSKKKPEG